MQEIRIERRKARSIIQAECDRRRCPESKQETSLKWFDDIAQGVKLYDKTGMQFTNTSPKVEI